MGSIFVGDSDFVDVLRLIKATELFSPFRSRSRKDAYDLVKITLRNWTRNLDGIGVARIREFPLSSNCHIKLIATFALYQLLAY